MTDYRFLCSVPVYSDGEPIMPGDIVRHPDMHDSCMVTEVVLGLHGSFVRCASSAISATCDASIIDAAILKGVACQAVIRMMQSDGKAMCGFKTMRHDLFRRVDTDTPASLADEIDEWIGTEQDSYEPLHGIAERLRKMGEES